MKKFFFAALAALGLMASVGVTSCQKDAVVKGDIPVYGWYGWNDDVSADSLRSLYKEWKQHGIVGVCVDCHGFNVERIQQAAKIAHEEGLEYHAWVHSMLQGNDKDSTWYTVNRLGKSAFNPKDRAYVEYYSTVDPHNPEVVKYLAENYAKVAEIPEVDYVQLDYIRYADVVLSEGLWVKYDTIMGKKSPIGHDFGSLKIGPMEGSAKPASVNEFPGADYCYCDSCVADFKAKSGIDIREKVAAGVDPASVPGWAQFRCDNVTNCVNAICKAVHEKGKKISADVFPGPYVHLGGDEAGNPALDCWTHCESCQALKAQLFAADGLTESPERQPASGREGNWRLQQYMFDRVIALLRDELGKTPMFWYETDFHEIQPGCITFAWRHGLTQAAIDAAKRCDAKIILCPGEHCYLDYPMGYNDMPEVNWGMPTTTLEQTYRLDPAWGNGDYYDDDALRYDDDALRYDDNALRYDDDALRYDDDALRSVKNFERDCLMGVAGTLWTECIPSMERLYYMAYPRALALAEAGWSPQSRRSWPDFKRRAAVVCRDMLRRGVCVDQNF